MRVYAVLQVWVCMIVAGGLLRGGLSVGGHSKCSLCWLLVSPVILQSKPSLLRGKYVQCPGVYLQLLGNIYI